MSSLKKVAFQLFDRPPLTAGSPRQQSSSPLRPLTEAKTILKRTSSISKISPDTNMTLSGRTQSTTSLAAAYGLLNEPKSAVEPRILTEPTPFDSPQRLFYTEPELTITVPAELPTFGISRESSSTERLRRMHMKTHSTTNSENKVNLPAIRISPSRENQARPRVPMRARRGGDPGEHRSALTVLPSNSTMNLIERSRQKVMEKYVNKPVDISENHTARERQGTLMTKIDSIKDDIFKDKIRMQMFIQQHSQNMNLLEQKHYDPEFHLDGIKSVLQNPLDGHAPKFFSQGKATFLYSKKRFIRGDLKV